MKSNSIEERYIKLDLDYRYFTPVEIKISFNLCKKNPTNMKMMFLFLIEEFKYTSRLVIFQY